MRRLATVPPDARRLLLLAAADPTGDLALVSRAAEGLGIPESAARALESDGVLDLRAGVVFRHPLARSAVYRAATADERSAIHRALADATDPETDPDRRAWHRAQATSMPDEDVAAELERSAARAQARGGFAAAAAFLERSSVLTLDRCSSGRARARGGSGEVRGGRVRRGSHARCERGGGPVGRRPASGAGSPPRPHLVRRGTWERVRRGCCSPPPRTSSRSTLDGHARSISTRCPPPCSPVVWRVRVVLARSRPRCGPCPTSRIAARRGGPVARRIGPDDHRGSFERHAGRTRGLARLLERRHRSG